MIGAILEYIGPINIAFILLCLAIIIGCAVSFFDKDSNKAFTS